MGVYRQMSHSLLDSADMSSVAKAGPFLLVGAQSAKNPVTGLEVGLTLNENGGVLKYDMGVQTRQVIENLSTALREAGYRLQDVVDLTVFLADLDDYPGFYSIYRNYFNFEPAPACTVVQAMSPGRSFVSIKAMAYRAS